MVLRSVERSTLAMKAAQELERMIVSGEWPEGARIPAEPELMESLGVSRNTVREALRALMVLGMLEARPGDGTYVRATSVLRSSLARRLLRCSLEETLEARECLERQAARLAAERRTEAQLAELRRGHEALAKAFDDDLPTEELIEMLLEQEKRLAEAAGNALLEELFDAIAEPVRDASRSVIDTVRTEQLDRSLPRRLSRELIEAIAARDSAAADRLVLEKSQLVRSWLRLEET